MGRKSNAALGQDSELRLPIVKHLKAGEICYEPFSGSAPQIIAAEMHGRRCFAMELEPRYVDVAVVRWEKFTNKKGVRSDAPEAANG